ncbi:hypothetical protein DQ244_08890 [Blastococcus sp. TBT05-19]|uniref:hypothetical protein n=1 Tax=Blastococcus sp. TBT05-19 TaxID=2250581 RepID=UPI000DEAC6BF|nr:hypothetical protein [Blastococcus sp. TBT05-19]RBY92368.1 hypothetical protein DQ244_08890 [Blastococcus sp. TBT05-19]
MWTSYHSDGEPDPDFLRRMNPPENEVPVALPQNRVLARTDDVGVAVIGLHVYTTGVAFQLVAQARPSAQITGGRDLNELFWRHGPGAGRGFLLGVEFADGRRAGTMAGRGDANGLIFHQGGGSGGHSSIHQSWWLSPVPPPGPLRLVLRCDDLGIQETTVELDGAGMARAVDDVVELWPWEPPRSPDPEPPPLPDLPADSWFAR